MMKLTRRQALAGSGGLIGSLLVPQRFASAAVGSTLKIAYNVNLPSFDPTVGPSSVNPTIQAIYRSIFDQYIGQKPDLAFEPGLLTAWGWNDDKTKVWMDVREGVVWHDGTPFTPEDVVWSIKREAKPDGGNPVSFVWASLDNFKIDGKRITADVKQFDPDHFQVDGLPDRLRAAEGLFRESRAGGLRKEAGRHRPLHGRCLRGQCLSAAQGQPQILGRQAGVRDGGLQVRARRHQPRRRDRKRLVGRHAGSAVRGIRPAQGQGRA